MKIPNQKRLKLWEEEEETKIPNQKRLKLWEEEEETKMPNQKRLKLWEEEEEEEEDRISSLPDAIILRILSLLPTRYAIRTGLLSKRWKYLWTSLTNLYFSYVDTEEDEDEDSCFLKFLRKFPSCEQLDKFFEFIDKTLILYSEKINKFSLKFAVPFKYSTARVVYSVSSWLRFATRRDVEELRLDIFDESFEYYVMPNFLYTHSSLTKLFTKFCIYPLPRPGQISWRLLRELIISQTDFNDGVLQMIFLGSPLLEYLKLSSCRGLPNIDTAANMGLRRLVLEEVRGKGRHNSEISISISIPSVTSLEILGDSFHTQFKLLNVSSLLDVTLDFQVDQLFTLPQHTDQVWELLESVKHVKKLTVGKWCMQVLSVLVTKALRPPLSKNKCTCLTLTTCIEKWDFPGVACLLDSSPYLEELVVDSGCNRSSQFYTVKYPIAEDYWSSQPGSFYCLQRFLKTIRIVGLDPLSHANNVCLLEFIKFLLQSAKVLEKLVISAPRETYWRTDKYYSLARQLLSVPRSSTQAVVLLPE